MTSISVKMHGCGKPLPRWKRVPREPQFRWYRSLASSLYRLTCIGSSFKSILLKKIFWSESVMIKFTVCLMILRKRAGSGNRWQQVTLRSYIFPVIFQYNLSSLITGLGAYTSGLSNREGTVNLFKLQPVRFFVGFQVVMVFWSTWHHMTHDSHATGNTPTFSRKYMQFLATRGPESNLDNQPAMWNFHIWHPSHKWKKCGKDPWGVIFNLLQDGPFQL